MSERTVRENLEAIAAMRSREEPFGAPAPCALPVRPDVSFFTPRGGEKIAVVRLVDAGGQEVAKFVECPDDVENGHDWLIRVAYFTAAALNAHGERAGERERLRSALEQVSATLHEYADPWGYDAIPGDVARSLHGIITRALTEGGEHEG